MIKTSHKLPFYLSIWCLSLLLTGCVSHPIAPQYYTLKPITTTEKLSTQYSIGIQPVTIPSWLDQSQISWVNGDVKQIVLNQDRWVGPLAQVIDENTLRNFRRIFPEASVSLGPWVRSASPDRIVTFRIMVLERQSNELSAEIAISVLDQQRKELSSRFHTYQQPLADSASASEFAKALGDLLGQADMDAAALLSEEQR